MAYRDGQRALSLAHRFCRATGNEDPASLDALAATYAESGRFADAAETAAQALKLAQASDVSKLAMEITHLRQLYEMDRPNKVRSWHDIELTDLASPAE